MMKVIKQKDTHKFGILNRNKQRKSNEEKGAGFSEYFV